MQGKPGILVLGENDVNMYWVQFIRFSRLKFLVLHPYPSNTGNNLFITIFKKKNIKIEIKKKNVFKDSNISFDFNLI